MTANKRALITVLPQVRIITTHGPMDAGCVIDLSAAFAITLSTPGNKMFGSYTLTHKGTGASVAVHHRVEALAGLYDRLNHLDWSGDSIAEITERLKPEMRPIMRQWREEHA